MDNFVLFSILILVLVFLCLFFHRQNNHIVTSHYKIKSEKIDFRQIYTLRIVHLSDLHSKKFENSNFDLLIKIKMEKPDIIVFTGDLSSRHHKNANVATALLSGLSQIAPVFVVPGNHDHGNKFSAEFFGRYESTGAKILSNEIAVFQGISICGIDPYSDDGGDIFQKIDTADGFKLVLIHDPKYYVDSFSGCGADLVLCGHTHGGQVILPWLGGIFASGQGFFPKYSRGIYDINDTKLIVNRGLGNTVPSRFNNFPEIVVIDLYKDLQQLFKE